MNIPFPIRTIDLSDPSVTSIVKKLNEQPSIDLHKTVNKTAAE
ncbi:hypothetical protein ACT3TH_06035 [Psychrobacter sp. AOP22-C1-C5]